MKMIRKISTGLAALVVAAGLTSGAIAQTATGDLEVEITPATDGALSVQISDLFFGQHEYSLQPRDVDGEITIGATDDRGSADGWTVSLSGEHFVEGTFTIDNLGLTGGDVEIISDTGHPTEQAPITQDAIPIMTEATTVLSAEPGTGAGDYEAGYGATLTIPAGTLVDTYETTLTVTITGTAPGED